MFKTIAPLNAIISLRFLGLFLVMPVLSLYALEMPDATASLVGMAVGGYALTQALFQVPFGYSSDKFGRKKTLFFGLLLFFAGSLICAYADNIYTLLLGRFLQGAGAIGSVITATISDVVKEEERGKAMAMMGGSIALAFGASMFLGPMLAGSFGVDFLFLLTATFAFMSIIILFVKVPNPPSIRFEYEAKSSTADVIKDMNLMYLNITGFMQKGLMTAAFVIIPIYLTKEFGWEKAELWKAYVPAMITGIFAMGFSGVMGEKHNKVKLIFLLSVACFVLAFLTMALSYNETSFIVAITIFFIGFNMMEPLLQSVVSKTCKAHQKGVALGVASTFSFLGTFLCGTFAGIMLQDYNVHTLGFVVAAVSVLWFLWTLRMPNPKKFKTLYLQVNDVNMTALKNSAFVHEFYINETEGKVIIRYEFGSIEAKELHQEVTK